ncbi:MAG: NIPSNAP family protein [Acidocella sp. 20-57-95]|nr:MAG: NIPSNAP family protein [Acidocella sp. 20-57-95]OYV59175.1 MAG: NIPSNAP family protein [Acidocella sp. 21-58-7]HQT63007.1 NIPSNAP family protein [Acidocella sp.]HQU03163.1 NIPSNAP family protein [Acidocella sp.]
MIYELRVYDCLPGKLPLLLKRFANTTLPLWDKHGIVQAGFWTVEVGPNNNQLYYLLAWESLAERERIWGAFITDPQWLADRAASEVDGPFLANISNQFLKPTKFSAVK